MGDLITVKNLTKIFSKGFFGKKGIVAVDNVSFSLPSEKATIFTLAGESGSGKSTIARLILGIIKPTSGNILYRGNDIWDMSGKGLKEYRCKVQAIFQDPYSTFNPIYKVDHSLFTPLKEFKLSDRFGIDEDDLVNESLEMVGLNPKEVLGKYPHQLSGGERQRIMMARAIMFRPEVIVADEPVSMIDASLRAGILHLMLKFKENFGTSFLYITHDLSTAYYISDIIALMYMGSVVEIGVANKVIEEPFHPYVDLLVNSIPIPDPERKWRGQIALPYKEVTENFEKGCKFYERCPQRIDKCAMKKPELKEIGDNHWVACHLYDGAY
jgi:peptide/nickel transport system ATP-binding protein